MKRSLALLICLLALGLTAPLAAENRGDDDCDCAAIELELNGVDVVIDDLSSTLEGYESQLAIPGKIATSLAGYGVRAVNGRCKSGEGRVGLEGGWKLCFPIGNSAEVIPFITDFLDQLGYDPSDFREAAENVDSIRDSLESAKEDRRRILNECVRCRCTC